MSNCCCICGISISQERPRNFFCHRCYTDHKEAILAKKEWVTYLIKLERHRRYHEGLGIVFIYLGNEWDICYRNGVAELVPLKEHWEE